MEAAKPIRRDTLWLTMTDGADVFVRVWEPDGEPPRAVLQVAHGMVEHSGRYDAFAAYLTERGVAVVASDQRGHGRTGEKAGSLGHLADKDGFDRLVGDLLAINEWIGRRWPAAPRFLLGHSMGSLVARRYVQVHGETVAGIVAVATVAHPGLLAQVGRWLARLQMRRRSPRHPSLLLTALVFDGYNNRIPRPKTAFDWLTRDPEALASYVADPYCGFVPSAGFYYDLLTGLRLVHDARLIRRIPKDLPMLFLAGDADPVGGYGKGVEKIAARYRRLGLRNIRLIVYEGARHELLNELNKEQVYNDILGWLNEVLAQRRGA